LQHAKFGNNITVVFGLFKQCNFLAVRGLVDLQVVTLHFTLLWLAATWDGKWERIEKKNGRGLLGRNCPCIYLEVKMGNHGKPFSGWAMVGFEPTFYRMHRIRFAEFLYLKVMASRSASGMLLHQLVS
jgi:hypothetical protein